MHKNFLFDFLILFSRGSMYEENINIVNSELRNVDLGDTLRYEPVPIYTPIEKEAKPKNVKKLRIGMEAEAFVLDSDGYVINEADKLIKSVKKNFLDITMRKEVGKNMLEIASFPYENVQDTMQNLIRSFESLLLCAEKEGFNIYTLGTYPGVYTPEIRQDKPYKIQEQILGKK